jgi:hypothetical protein
MGKGAAVEDIHSVSTFDGDDRSSIGATLVYPEERTFMRYCYAAAMEEALS